jgi:hypothetical protein
MKKQSLYIIILLVTVAGISNAYAQQNNNKDSAILLFNQLYIKYKTAGHLSFNIVSSHRTIRDFDDSLSGKVNLNQGNYHIQVGTRDILHNSTYTVTLFKRDSLMYITGAAGLVNPISILDSIQSHLSSLDLSLSLERSRHIITVIFPEGAPYKKVKLVINDSNNFLRQEQIIVKASLVNNPAKNSDRSLDDWVTVDSKFFNYTVNQLGDSEFSENGYFIKNTIGYTPTDTYKQYKVYSK